MILGTAAYMAPEQARGQDRRTSARHLGVRCVLYEMLTGRRAFQGDDLPDTLANVLKREPDWNALPADVLPHVRMLIQRCLARDRRERLADMSVALFVMTEPSLVTERPRTLAASHLRTQRWLGRRLVIPTAMAIVVGAAAGIGVWLAMRPSAPRVARFALSPTGAAALSLDQVSIDLAITRDGTHIVFKGVGTNGNQFFVRALNRLEPTPLTGLGAPHAPFLSPDGQSIGFVDVGSSVGLKKVAITGGPVLPVCGLDGQSRGAVWSEDGSTHFCDIPARHGPPARVVGPRRTDGPDDTGRPARGERSHLAAVLARRPVRAVYDYHDRRDRGVAGGGPRPANRRAEDAAAGRRSGAVCAEWASGVPAAGRCVPSRSTLIAWR